MGQGLVPQHSRVEQKKPVGSRTRLGSKGTPPASARCGSTPWVKPTVGSGGCSQQRNDCTDVRQREWSRRSGAIAAGGWGGGGSKKQQRGDGIDARQRSRARWCDASAAGGLRPRESGSLDCNAKNRSAPRTWHAAARRTAAGDGLSVGLYTIFPSPILYGVWHTNGASVGGHILRNGRAIVLQ